jgi:hypothetical protein
VATALDADIVGKVVREMLDAMRNAHLQLVFGDPFRAMDYVEEAATAHRKLNELCTGEAANQALAGQIVQQVIGERMESLRELARNTLAKPMTTHQVLSIVEKPLVNSDGTA